MTRATNQRIAGLACILLLLLAFPVQAEEQGVLASRILDHDVLDGNGKLIGEVDDIVIRRSGTVKKLTVEFGGFIDIADTLAAVNFKNCEVKNGKVALDATQEQLRKKPEYSYFSQGLRPEYYYRARPYAGPRHYPPRGYPYGPHNENPPMEYYRWAFSPSRFLASTVINRPLINEGGKPIGRVQDLLINQKGHSIEKIILFSEDILGEDVYVALSYQPLGFTGYGLVYDIRPRELKEFVYPYEK